MTAAPESLGGVLVGGNIVFDILVRPVDRVVWGTTAWVESIEQHMGGNGANTSYTLARLGVPVRLVAWVGRDDFGDRLLGQLEAAGVDTAFVRRSGEPTAATVALVRSGGDRLFLHRPGASATAFDAPVDFTAELLHGVSHFHLANPFALPRMRVHAAECLRRARAAGLSTSLDTGWDARGQWLEVLGPCLPDVDLLFANAEEARMLTGLGGLAPAAAEMRRLGAGVVVVKRGAEGCAVFSDAGECHAPGFRIDAVDTTGAGDCFAGGYLAALRHGLSCPEAARVANAAGALSAGRLGSTAGLLGWRETLAWIEGANSVPTAG